jgi:hypothetical protein
MQHGEMMSNLMSVAPDCPVFLLVPSEQEQQGMRTHVGGPMELCAALEDPAFPVSRVMALLGPYLSGKGWSLKEVEACWRAVQEEPDGGPFLILQLDGGDYLFDGVIRATRAPSFQMKRIFASPELCARSQA